MAAAAKPTSRDSGGGAAAGMGVRKDSQSNVKPFPVHQHGAAAGAAAHQAAHKTSDTPGSHAREGPTEDVAPLLSIDHGLIR